MNKIEQKRDSLQSDLENMQEWMPDELKRIFEEERNSLMTGNNLRKNAL